MKKRIYVLIVLLIVSGGLLSACREINSRTSENSPSKPLSIAEMKAKREKWEASPDGIKYKKWEASPEGMKVHASADKIRKQLKDSSDMEAVVISLSRQNKSLYGFGALVRINGEEYLLNNPLQQLRSLKVNDKIIIRSHAAGKSPKSPYLILWGDYVERNGKIIYKRPIHKGGC